MRTRDFLLTRLLVLSLFGLFLPCTARAGDIHLGTGMWLRFHHGPSTFQLAPGASLAADVEVVPSVRLGAKIISGAFFGNATGLELSAGFAPRVGPWLPEVGVAAQGVLGSAIFYYLGGTAYVDAEFPEWSAGLLLRPLRFLFGTFGVSVLEVMAGTDLRQFAKILIADVELFRVFVRLGGEVTE